MNQTHNVAYIGVGSNLNSPEKQVCLAIECIDSHADIDCLQVSKFYSSKPVAAGGMTQTQADKQPNYVNAVVQVKTSLSARVLLDELLALENRQGRLRLIKGAARTIDLDLLIFGDAVMREPGLLVPHPRISQRAFVLLPLRDISPNLVIPDLGKLADLIESCDTSSAAAIEKNCASAVLNTNINQNTFSNE